MQGSEQESLVQSIVQRTHSISCQKKKHTLRYTLVISVDLLSFGGPHHTAIRTNWLHGPASQQLHLHSQTIYLRFGGDLLLDGLRRSLARRESVETFGHLGLPRRWGFSI